MKITRHSFQIGIFFLSAYCKNNTIKLLGQWKSDALNLPSDRLICVLRHNGLSSQNMFTSITLYPEHTENPVITWFERHNTRHKTPTDPFDVTFKF